MNAFFFTARVTKDAWIVPTTASGTTVRFHAHIGVRGFGERDHLWVQITIQGRAADEVLPHLWTGQIVTVEGTVVGTEGGPVWVRARRVTPHILPDDDEAEAEQFEDTPA